ncbi:dihydrofolate reductase [hydrocarbon metagenome]|uniref:dihydrofolate reductase n=1 Tax=hydrocarbon metagenome TaxID=938273 RepID=A0A0W8FV04_9ZZZZ
MRKIIIVAVAKNNVIGKDGIMPWHSKEDLKHFKETTMGFPLIMGRKTFFSMGGKPLKGRLNIILTRDKHFEKPDDDVKVFASIEDAYDYCEKQNYEKVFVTGGGEIYKREINNVDELLISEMNVEAEGDTFFPEIDKDIWEVAEVIDYSEFTLKIYRKRN